MNRENFESVDYKLPVHKTRNDHANQFSDAKIMDDAENP